MTLTAEEVVISLQIDLTTDEDLLDGWQEIRSCYFRDYLSHSSKTVKHRLKATVACFRDGAKSYGEVSVWASSAWKPICRVNLADLPRINIEAVNDADTKQEAYSAAVDWLFTTGQKVVG